MNVIIWIQIDVGDDDFRGGVEACKWVCRSPTTPRLPWRWRCELASRWREGYMQGGACVGAGHESGQRRWRAARITCQLLRRGASVHCVRPGLDSRLATRDASSPVSSSWPLSTKIIILAGANAATSKFLKFRPPALKLFIYYASSRWFSSLRLCCCISSSFAFHAACSFHAEMTVRINYIFLLTVCFYLTPLMMFI